MDNSNVINEDKTNFLTEDELMKILLLYYPEEKEFVSLILSPINNPNFIPKIKKYFQNLKHLNTDDPFGKFYGIQNNRCIANNTKNENSIELNKTNTDLIFTLLHKLFNSSFFEDEDEEINLQLIKSWINQMKNCYNLTRISFISSKENNYEKEKPVNFFAFSITLKILIECFANSIKFLDIGIFDDNENIFFNTETESFHSDLFCCNLLYLYFFKKIYKKHDVILCLHFLCDHTIYESFTFRTSDKNFKEIKEILNLNVKNYDMLDFISDLSEDNLIKLNFYLTYKIAKKTYDNIINFINKQKKFVKINFYCDNRFINDKNHNLLKEINKCKELNISLIPYKKKNYDDFDRKKLDLKTSEVNVKSLEISGENIFMDNLPSDFKEIHSLKLLSKKELFFLDEKYKKNPASYLYFNLNENSLTTFNRLEQIYLKSLTLDQFFIFVSSLNTKTESPVSEILKIFLETDFTNSIITIDDENQDNKNSFTKVDILHSVDSLINNCDRLKNIRFLDINFINSNPENNLLLTKENGFYFVDLVLTKLKNCYHFSLMNHNIKYFPIGEEKPPDITAKINYRLPRQRQNTNRGRRNEEKEKEKPKQIERYSLGVDVRNCKCYNNDYNKEMVVCYNGSEVNDYSYNCDLRNIAPFLFSVKKGIPKLRPKTILFNIVKFFPITIKEPKMVSVGNLNN